MSMSTFTYSIRSKEGLSQQGQIDAESKEDAVKTILRPGWFMTSISSSEGVHKTSSLFSKSMSTLERIVFTDHLAEMVSSGTPIIEAIETYKSDEQTKATRLLSDIVTHVRQGKKLSEAMARHRDVFSPYYVAVVHAGEMTGQLDDSFRYIAKELRREFEFSEKIKSALMYPAFVLVVAFGVIMLLILLVIPKITELTKSFGGELPLATKIVAGGADFLTTYGVLVVIGMLLRLPKTKNKLDPYLLKLPLFGTILRHYQLSRFLRVLGSSVEYGIALATACDMVSDIVTSQVYKEAAVRLKTNITKGVSIANGLSRENPLYFPPFIIRSLKGSERTGTAAKALQRIAVFYENDVDRSLHRMTELIQPILTIILGVIVGAIALAVVTPIYQITSKIK